MIERDTLSREKGDLQTAEFEKTVMMLVRAELDRKIERIMPLELFRKNWNDAMSIDDFLNLYRKKKPYHPNMLNLLMDHCYKNLNQEVRKKVAEQVDIQFRKVTGHVGKLPSFSNAQNEKERHLISTWLYFRDRIVARQLDVLSPRHFEMARIMFLFLHKFVPTLK